MFEIYLFLGVIVVFVCYAGFNVLNNYRLRKQEEKLDQEVYNRVQNHQLTEEELENINRFRELGGLPSLTMVEAQTILSFRKQLTMKQLISGDRDRVESNGRFLVSYVMPVKNDSFDSSLNQLTEKFYKD